MSLSRLLLILGAIAVLGVSGWYGWRRFAPGASATPQGGAQGADGSDIVIDRQPVVFAMRTFDPGNPPAEMPPLSPGEAAVCDSNFGVDARVAGRALPTDATDAIATVTRVTLVLQLQVTIWVPQGASEHVIDHEQGHRQIAEHFYGGAEQIARQIAGSYLGKKTLIAYQAGAGAGAGAGAAAGGNDLNGALGTALMQMSTEISEEYNKEMDSEPAQLRFDDITDHARNDVPAQEAIARALKDTGADAARIPGN